MHKREIMKLMGLVAREGYTLVPLSLYFLGSRVKVALGLCKGKHTYDKKEAIQNRDIARQTAREIKKYL